MGYPIQWISHIFRLLFLCTESYIRFMSDLPSIRCGYSDLLDFACFLHGGATFVCSCLPTSIPCPVLYDEGGTAPSSLLRHALFCRTVRKQAASRREQYTTRSGGPIT